MNTSVFENVKNYRRVLSNAIDNYQKMYGIEVEVLRASASEANTYVKAYGQSRVVTTNPSLCKSVGTVMLLANPMAMYSHYTSGGVGELEVHCSTDSIKLGDILKYRWIDGSCLEFQVYELPQTYAGIYYSYKIKGLFSTQDSSVDKPENNAPAGDSDKTVPKEPDVNWNAVEEKPKNNVAEKGSEGRDLSWLFGKGG